VSLIEALAALGVPAGGVLGIWIKSAYDRRLNKANAEESQSIVDLNEAQEEKLGADAAAVIANTALQLVAPLQAQVTGLAERVATLETENALTNRRLSLAMEYIQELLGWIKIHVPDRTPPGAPHELKV